MVVTSGGCSPCAQWRRRSSRRRSAPGPDRHGTDTSPECHAPRVGPIHSVGDLASFLHLRDSTVSQHLSLLRRDGLVQARRDGQTIWYSIASPPARRVLETLFEIFCKPASLRAVGCASGDQVIVPSVEQRTMMNAKFPQTSCNATACALTQINARNRWSALTHSVRSAGAKSSKCNSAHRSIR